MRDTARVAVTFRTVPLVRVIQPRSGWLAVNVEELWAYRSVLLILIRRDLKVRYAQTALGAGWAVLQPVIPMVIFTVVFGRLGKMPSDGVPYPVFALAALVPWTYFSTSVLGATTSLISNPELVTKVYFPRLAIPLALVLGALVDFGIGFLLLLLLMLVLGTPPRPSALLLIPLLVALMVMMAAGFGFWLSALSARYRDVKHVMPVVLQVLMYASPVVYPSSLVPAPYRALYAINPLVGVIDGFRAALLHTKMADPRTLLIASGVSAALLVSGALFFRRTERLFADVL
ncbi:MAG TPA: ABC transporter permease [Gemmatimonadaceae bacterium]|nr:ABC transporter permease [Gemmatimonadaceae bacterium]